MGTVKNLTGKVRYQPADVRQALRNGSLFDEVRMLVNRKSMSSSLMAGETDRLVGQYLRIFLANVLFRHSRTNLKFDIFSQK